MPRSPCTRRSDDVVRVAVSTAISELSLFIPALVQHTSNTLDPLINLARLCPVFPRLCCACYSILPEFEFGWLASVDGLGDHWVRYGQLTRVLLTCLLAMS